MPEQQLPRLTRIVAVATTVLELLAVVLFVSGVAVIGGLGAGLLAGAAAALVVSWLLSGAPMPSLRGRR